MNKHVNDFSIQNKHKYLKYYKYIMLCHIYSICNAQGTAYFICKD